MTFYLAIGFIVVSLLFYALGRSDGEKGNEGGLIILAFAIVIVLTWALATEWAMR